MSRKEFLKEVLGGIAFCIVLVAGVFFAMIAGW